MIVDLIFAACALIVAVATLIFFYGVGFAVGYDKGRTFQLRATKKFVDQAREAFTNQGLGEPHSHGRQGLN